MLTLDLSDHLLYLGAGPQSQEVLGTTFAFDPPLAPHIRLQTTDDVTRVNITWSQSNENPIQGFRLFWRKIPENWIQISERLDSGIRWHLVAGLQCGQHFQFYLKAFNARGDSPASDMLSRDLTRLSGQIFNCHVSLKSRVFAYSGRESTCESCDCRQSDRS